MTTQSKEKEVSTIPINGRLKNLEITTTAFDLVTDLANKTDSDVETMLAIVNSMVKLINPHFAIVYF